MKTLNKTFIPSILIVFLVLVNISCEDYLEVTPTSSISDETLWKSPATAQLFLNNVYSGLPNTHTAFDPFENWSDDAVNGVTSQYSYTIYSSGAYTPDNVQHFWGYFTQIRKCNLFLQRLQESGLDATWSKKASGEARFLRAYYYLLVARAHGGAPIITEVLNFTEQGDDIYRARNTAIEVFQFISTECNSILNDLPEESADGRVTKGAALALKGYAELFRASKLHNPDNDASLWAAAASTYKSLIDLNVYQLFPDYNLMFFEQNNGNSETIFAKHHLGGTGLGGSREGYYGPSYSQVFSGWRLLTPTQELVDEYAMANGLTIDDPASGYDPQDPYSNREKRFYESINFDGNVWNEAKIVTRRGVGSLNQIDLTGGNATGTGYYLRKALNPDYAQPGGNQLSSADWILFRYAEVLLGYAEAQNEATGPDQSIYDAINQVRARSELPTLTVGLTQDEMRTAIRRERRVELAFEEKRWYDLLRWKIAEDKLNPPDGTFHGMEVEESNGKVTYTVVPGRWSEVRFDPSKHYFLPIPQDAMDRNPNLVQNPGY